MDTKSKNFNDRFGVRATAFALCALFFAAACAGWVNVWAVYRSARYGASGNEAYVVDFRDLFGAAKYEESRGFQGEFQNHLVRLQWIFEAIRAKNAEEAAAAAALPAEMPEETAASANPEEVSQDPAESPAHSGSSVDTASGFAPGDIYANTPDDLDYNGLIEQWEIDRYREMDFDGDGLVKYWEFDQYRDDEARENEIRNRESESRRREYERREAERTLRDLERIDGLRFYVSDGETTIGDAETMDAAMSGAGGSARIHPVGGLTEKENDAAAITRAFKTRAAWLVYADGKLERSPATPARYAGMEEALLSGLRSLASYYTDDSYSLYYDSLDPTALLLCVSFDEGFLAERAALLSDARAKAGPWILVMLAGLALAFMLFVYLVVTTGRRDEEGRRKLYKADLLFTELQLAVLAAAGGFLFVTLIVFAGGQSFLVGYTVGRDVLADTSVMSAAGAILAAVGLWGLLSLTRCLKARRFFRNTLVLRLCSLFYRGVRAAYRGIRALYDKRNPMSKTVLLALAICLLSATVFLAPVVFVLVLVFGSRWVKKYAEIKRGVEEVKNGNLSWKIPVAEDARGEFDELARGVNAISDASGAAIQNELKAQRLKTDLISGVSHDIKTPLTSIITYVDLLKREGPDSPQAAEYIDVLDQKSQRLKKLTEDLFEAAKASSGSIPVRMETIDLLSLIRQGLGEMNEGILARRLDVILHFEAEKHYVCADGQLLWRIVENLLGNVQKYALEGSRVYIDLSEKRTAGGGMTLLEIKNISKDRLNIGAEELMERFTRGDASRATEGSGLGLAIAKDLARLQNGWFELKIDGDLFKAMLMLETRQEPAKVL